MSHPSINSPHPSTVDFPFFFSDFHDLISSRLIDFVESWKEGDYQDDWLGTLNAVRQLSESGLSKLCIPEIYQGESVNQPYGVDVRSITLARECLAWKDGLLDCAFAMQGLGSYPITLAGSEAQKEMYLPGFIDGSRIGAFALTEPDAGSDVASIKTKAKRDDNGDYTLHGSKTFISNAGVATQYIVFASTDGRKKTRGISAFIVKPDDPGVKIEPFEVMAPHPIGTLNFWRCKIPGNRLIGEEGQGFKIAMQTLNTFRLSVAGAALGMARRALSEAIHHAMNRKQFKGPLIDQQQIQSYLADCATELDAARLLVYRAAYRRDLFDTHYPKDVAMAKLYATEIAQKIIDRCLQIQGGRGVKKGNTLERLYREVRALRIYEGASEIQKLIIAKGLKDEYTALDSLK
jgi:acyl-CoA dehydrogenase